MSIPPGWPVDGQRVIQGSIITADLESTVRGSDGVAAVGRLGQGTFTVSVADGERYDTSIIGFKDPDLGAPRQLVTGRFPTGPCSTSPRQRSTPSSGRR
jgi:hemin transport system permease protein